MKTFSCFIALAIIAFIFTSCSEHPGYKKTDDGLFYKFYVQNEDSAKPVIGDVMSVKISYTLFENDSLLFTSDSLYEASRLQLMETKYKGDICEGLAMMAVGDSASFIVCADSFYLKNIGLDKEKIPDFIKPESNIRFEVKLISFQTKAEYEKEKELKYEKFQAMMEERKAKEPEDIKKYVKDSSITVSPTTTGLYYIEKKKGTGVKPVDGDTVYVHYTGSLLNGTMFASSYGGEPIAFVLGSNKVIPGWEEGIALMREEGEARLVIPSDLAYGSEYMSELVLPYTPLVFDIYLVKIN